MTIVLDTDVVSATIRPSPSMHLIRRLAIVPPDEQAITAITAGELVYGAAKRGSVTLQRRVGQVLAEALAILPFDAEAASVYGRLRAELESIGTPLDDADLRIASICLARDVTLITGNVRHFGRVPGLRVEDWLAEDEPGSGV